jgi:hypothetical protein
MAILASPLQIGCYSIWMPRIQQYRKGCTHFLAAASMCWYVDMCSQMTVDPQAMSH